MIHSEYPNQAETTGVDYDAELRKHNEILRQAYGIQSRDYVLDIGCGTGQTTRDAARLAPAGRVEGVDVSAPMIDQARRLTAEQGLRNVNFEQADAETHRFPATYFDVAISRFGTMFFHDPVAAFSNIARSMRPEGRLVMMVWQSQNQNEWFLAIQHALAADAAVLPGSPAAPDAFSLADPVTIEGILTKAGFSEPTFTDVHQPVYYGPNVAVGLEWVSRFSCVSNVLQRLSPASRDRVREQLRDTLAAHAGKDGVWFDSRAWIVTAHVR